MRREELSCRGLPLRAEAMVGCLRCCVAAECVRGVGWHSMIGEEAGPHAS